jgi:hypothetical protein
MSNYDDLLREKENEDMFNDSSMEKHWAALEKKYDADKQQTKPKYRNLLRSVIGIAAVSLLVFLWFTFFNEKKIVPSQIAVVIPKKSAIAPPLNGTNVPYETYTFDAATGDTIFTRNGSIIVFPKNAVLNVNGEVVKGNIEVRTREFNDVFDYSIAGIPMEYDSAGVQYKFISSAMIDINAYQNGQLLKVNPAAKPQLNLVSTNRERKTSLYKLDTISGKWEYKGNEEITEVNVGAEAAFKKLVNPGTAVPENYTAGDFKSDAAGNGEVDDAVSDEVIEKPIAPQKASSTNPVITVQIDPASFKELMVYDGLKFEIINNAMTELSVDKVEGDAAVLWNNVELQKGKTEGTYKVKFSTANKTAAYDVKPVLEGKDFEEAEKIYQQKLKEYAILQKERKKKQESNSIVPLNIDMVIVKDSAALNIVLQQNKKVEELNKLIIERNKLIAAENKRIEAINKENKRVWDSITKATNDMAERQRIAMERQQAVWQQQNRTAALEQNLVRSFQIDGFGYWNCDQPTLPGLTMYASSLKTNENKPITYQMLCIATEGINRIQNYYSTTNIGLMPNSSYFGWAFNANEFYYFTKQDFAKASITNSPNTIALTMHLYEGEAKNYEELKGFIFNVNNTMAVNSNFKQ